MLLAQGCNDRRHCMIAWYSGYMLAGIQPWYVQDQALQMRRYHCFVFFTSLASRLSRLGIVGHIGVCCNPKHQCRQCDKRRCQQEHAKWNDQSHSLAR